MRKKLLRFLCTALMTVVCMSVNAQATSGSCGANATWSYESTTLTISGTGEMNDYAYGEARPLPGRHPPGRSRRLRLSRPLLHHHHYLLLFFFLLFLLLLFLFLTQLFSQSFNLRLEER